MDDQHLLTTSNQTHGESRRAMSPVQGDNKQGSREALGCMQEETWWDGGNVYREGTERLIIPGIRRRGPGKHQVGDQTRSVMRAKRAHSAYAPCSGVHECAYSKGDSVFWLSRFLRAEVRDAD